MGRVCNICIANDNYHSPVPKMLTEIYYELDEFYKHTYSRILRISQGRSSKKRKPKGLTEVEIATILVYYHLSYYKNFKRFYTEYVCKDLQREFKSLPTYKNFIGLIPGVFIFMMYFLIHRCRKAQRTGRYFIDSTSIKACHPKRAKSNKVMKEVASWGKTSVGWFYGLKIHLIINELGELVKVQFTTGKKSDNDLGLLMSITKGLNGWIFGDKGYIINAKKKEALERNGELKLVTKRRKKMKPDLTITQTQKAWLAKRGVIECTVAGLKEECNIEHTRHRSAKNATIQMMGALIAYTFRERLPSVSIDDQKYLDSRNYGMARA